MEGTEEEGEGPLHKCKGVTEEDTVATEDMTKAIVVTTKAAVVWVVPSITMQEDTEDEAVNAMKAMIEGVAAPPAPDEEEAGTGRGTVICIPETHRMAADMVAVDLRLAAMHNKEPEVMAGRAEDTTRMALLLALPTPPTLLVVTDHPIPPGAVQLATLTGQQEQERTDTTLTTLTAAMEHLKQVVSLGNDCAG